MWRSIDQFVIFLRQCGVNCHLRHYINFTMTRIPSISYNFSHKSSSTLDTHNNNVNNSRYTCFPSLFFF
ncbi:uncharacterized protein DS421_16g529360 [Arachis hypogaea]|nr:uncharacterized protein DS421_16g529360 [Arachis hypogaea]